MKRTDKKDIIASLLRARRFDVANVVAKLTTEQEDYATAEPMDTQVFSAMKLMRKALQNFEGIAKKHSKAVQLADVEQKIDQALQEAKKILQGAGGG